MPPDWSRSALRGGEAQRGCVLAAAPQPGRWLVAVMLPDGTYTVAKRAHPWPRDSHGTPVPPALSAAGTARSGGAYERTDGVWVLRLDPAEWPVRDGDKVTGPDGDVWTVTGEPRLIQNNAADDVDYIAVVAALDPPVVP